MNDIEKIRELYLTTTPDEENLHTKSIAFSWGTFSFSPTGNEKCEFYLAPKKSIEEFLTRALTAQKEEFIKVVEGMKKIYRRI